jgi:hypothetical protein
MRYPTPPIAPLDLWWQTNWTSNAATLNVTYNQLPNPRPSNQTQNINYTYNPIGVLINKTETTNIQSQDTYGKLANTTTIGVGYSMSAPFYLDPYPPAAYGSLVYPASSSFEQSQFFRNFTSTATYTNYTTENPYPLGTYNEDFFGHITTSAGGITFTGNVTAPLTWLNGNQAFGNRTEKTSYFLNGKSYAETTLTTTWNSISINGADRLMNERDVAETFFADGSQRTSEIIIAYQRDVYGAITGISGAGTVVGVDVIEGLSVNYAGTINVTYVFNQHWAWIKTGYYETRTAASGLLKRVPFEVLFIDDPLMRPLF